MCLLPPNPLCPGRVRVRWCPPFPPGGSGGGGHHGVRRPARRAGPAEAPRVGGGDELPAGSTSQPDTAADKEAQEARRKAVHDIRDALAQAVAPKIAELIALAE